MQLQKNLSNLQRAIPSPIREQLGRLLLFGAVIVAFNVALFNLLGPGEINPLHSQVFEEGFEGADLQGWSTIAGQWQIRDGFLIQEVVDAGQTAVVIPMTSKEGEKFEMAADYWLDESATGAALLFNLNSERQEARSQRVEIVREGDMAALLIGFIDQNSVFQSQVRVNLPGPADQYTTGRLAVIQQEGLISVALNGQTLASEIPLEYEAGWFGFGSQAGAVRFDNARILIWEGRMPEQAAAVPHGEYKPAVDGEIAEDLVPVVAEPIDLAPGNTIDAAALPADGLAVLGRLENGLEEAGWLPVDGDWKVIDGTLVQTQPDGYDHYASHIDRFSNFRLTSQFEILQGEGGAGVMFNLAAIDHKRRGHLVRLADDGTSIFWGYFDENGVFVGQGSARVEKIAGLQTMTIYARETTYDIMLNEQPVARDITLTINGGHLGITNSQSVVRFDSVVVSRLDGEDLAASVGETWVDDGPGEDGDLLANLDKISGDWISEGTKIRQVDTAGIDQILGLNVFGQNYSLEATITMTSDPELSDVGAGMLFHLPEPDRKNGGHLVRFVNGGQSLMWGFFQEDGVFSGQGSLDLNLETGRPHSLRVVVTGDTFDIVVNGEEVITDIPLQRREGWIGLTTFRGPVSFENLNLTLGELRP